MNRLPLIFIILLFISFCACEEEEKEIAYYNFSADNQANLPAYKKDQRLKFASQSGDTAYMTVTRDFKGLHYLYTVGMGFFTTYAASYFYYDFWDLEFRTACRGKSYVNQLYFQRWPLNQDAAEKDIYTTFPSGFYGTIDFGLWNKDQRLAIPFEKAKTFMSIGTRVYTHVYVFDSQTTQSTDTAHVLLPQVNKLYYDTKKGIIGYDDLNAGQWRLVE